MSEHKLSGCRSRALFQLERASAFLAQVMPVMPEDDSDPLRQYLYQSSVLMVQSYFEEYLRCMVAIGTFWKTPLVREHLQPLYPDENFDVMPAAIVGHFAQRRVSFDEKARRLKEIFVVLTEGSPFADANAERKLLDFVKRSQHHRS